MESVESVDEFEVDNGAPCYSLGLKRIGSTQKLELCETVSVGTCTRGKMNVYLPEHMHGGGHMDIREASTHPRPLAKGRVMADTYVSGLCLSHSRSVPNPLSKSSTIA